MKKGESLRDTVQTIEAMGIDAMVVRHPAAGAPHRVAGWIDAAVVNAGDGRHEHPTQALLDVLTLRRHRGADLDGAAHRASSATSATRGSPAAACRRSPLLGADVTLVGAAHAAAASRSRAGRCAVSHDLDDVLPEVDVVYAAAHPARAPAARRCSRACASTRRATGSPTSARASGSSPTRW